MDIADKNFKAYAYIRFNNIESKEKQEDILQKYCNENEVRIEKIYRDVSSSGLSKDRPALNKLLEEIDKNKNKSNIILVSEFSRMSRDIKEIIKMTSEREQYMQIYSVSDKQFMDYWKKHSIGAMMYIEKPPIDFVLEDYEFEDINDLLEKIDISKNKVILKKGETYSDQERKMINKLKEEWKSPYEKDLSNKIKIGKKYKKLKMEQEECNDEEME